MASVGDLPPNQQRDDFIDSLRSVLSPEALAAIAQWAEQKLVDGDREALGLPRRLSAVEEAFEKALPRVQALESVVPKNAYRRKVDDGHHHYQTVEGMDDQVSQGFGFQLDAINGIKLTRGSWPLDRRLTIDGTGAIGPFEYDHLVDADFAAKVAAGDGTEGMELETVHGHTFKVWSVIQSAIDDWVSESGNESILVVPGTYAENVSIEQHLIGGGPNRIVVTSPPGQLTQITSLTIAGDLGNQTRGHPESRVENLTLTGDLNISSANDNNVAGVQFTNLKVLGDMVFQAASPFTVAASYLTFDHCSVAGGVSDNSKILTMLFCRFISCTFDERWSTSHRNGASLSSIGSTWFEDCYFFDGAQISQITGPVFFEGGLIGGDSTSAGAFELTSASAAASPDLDDLRFTGVTFAYQDHSAEWAFIKIGVAGGLTSAFVNLAIGTCTFEVPNLQADSEPPIHILWAPSANEKVHAALVGNSFIEDYTGNRIEDLPTTSTSYSVKGYFERSVFGPNVPADFEVEILGGTKNLYVGTGTTVGAGITTTLPAKNLALTADTELTISGGVITATQTHHTIDTEETNGGDGDPTDDLDTINGLVANQLYFFYPAHTDRTVVFKHGTGNLYCVGSQDITLDDSHDFVWGFSPDGTNMYVEGVHAHSGGAGGVHNLLDGADHPDTVADTVTRGSLVYGNATPKWDELVIGAANTILASDGTDAAWTAKASAASHTMLDDATHTDGVGDDAVTAGSIIIGNDTPKWDELGIVVPGANIINAVAVANGETTPTWKSLLDATNPAAAGPVAAPGTSLIMAHRDHVHALGTLGATWVPGAQIIGNYDWTGRPVGLAIGDGAFGFSLATGNPFIVLDTAGGENDYLYYDRAANLLTFAKNGIASVGMNATGLLADVIAELTGAAGVTIDGLLIKDGAAGSVDFDLTDITAAELEDLSDGGESALHTHAAGAPGVHKDTHDPEDGADPLDTAVPNQLVPDNAQAEGSSHSLSRADHDHEITCDTPNAIAGVQAGAEGSDVYNFARADHDHEIVASIDDNDLLVVDATDGAPNDDEYARFTATGLEGRTEAQLKADMNLEIGTDVLAEQAIGIADNNLVEVDGPGAGAPANGEYAKWTANGLEGKAVGEVVTDLSLDVPKRSIIIRARSWEPNTTNPCADAVQTEEGTGGKNYITRSFAANEQGSIEMVMPENYSGGTVTWWYYWLSPTGSSAGDTVIFGLRGSCIANGAVIAAAQGAQVTITDTLLTGVGRVHKSPESGALTIDAAAAGDYVIFELERTGGDMAEEAPILAVYIRYPTDTYSDT